MNLVSATAVVIFCLRVAGGFAGLQLAQIQGFH
jgi:hypothetical protein